MIYSKRWDCHLHKIIDTPIFKKVLNIIQILGIFNCVNEIYYIYEKSITSQTSHKYNTK